jgi:hypothetical protein
MTYLFSNIYTDERKKDYIVLDVIYIQNHGEYALSGHKLF